MSLEPFRLTDFSGGLNDVDPPLRLGPTEHTWNSHDLEIDGTRGVLMARRGLARYTPSLALPVISDSTYRVTNMRTYRRANGPGDLLIMCNDRAAVWRQDPNAAANTTTVVQAGLVGSGGEYDFIQASDSVGQEYVWALNGFTAPAKMQVDTSAWSGWAGSPPNGKMARVWKNRMIIAGVPGQAARLYYSTIANPESWPANNFIDIKSTDDEQEPITAIEVIGESLLVFKASSVWLVFDPVSFDNRRIADIGCVGRLATARSVADPSEKVYFVARTGVYSTDGDDVKHESKMIDRRFNSSELLHAEYFQAYREKTNLRMLNDGKLYLYNFVAWGTYSFGIILYMDTKLSRPDGQHPWFKHTNAMSGITTMVSGYFRDHDINSFEVSGTKGILDTDGASGPQYFADLLRDDRWNDTWISLDDIEVSGYWESGFLEIHPNTEKMERVRRVNIHGDQGTVSATLQGDEDTIVSSGTKNLDVLSRFVRFRPESRGRFFQMTMDLRQGAHVMEVEMMVRGGKEH
jgi:hypothetical protein